MRCSKNCGEVQWISSEVRQDSDEVQQILCKDCGEVVNNWLVNLRRAIMHAQFLAIKRQG